MPHLGSMGCGASGPGCRAVNRVVGITAVAALPTMIGGRGQLRASPAAGYCCHFVARQSRPEQHACKRSL